jgi:hypothetical protein
MRVSVRNLVDLGLAAVTMLLAVTSDVFLISVFKLHLQRILKAPVYRPIYSRSGRRNRVRY